MPSRDLGPAHRPGTERGTSRHHRVCLGPSPSLETWPCRLPGADAASGVLVTRGADGACVSLGPRPSPVSRGGAARLGLPRWGLWTRSSQLRGHETQTVTRSGRRFHGWTAIPVRKCKRRAKATLGGKGARGFPPHCVSALRPWRPSRDPCHTRVVIEPEKVTLRVFWMAGAPLVTVHSVRRLDNRP